MTGTAEYHRRVYPRRKPYFQRRYAARRHEAIEAARAYRRKNREAISIARRLRISVAVARLVLALVKTGMPVMRAYRKLEERGALQ